jgi:hypothetical protein
MSAEFPHDSPEGAVSRRVGNLMRQAREKAGTSTRRFAQLSAGRFSVRELRAFERGEAVLPDGIARELATLYGFDLDLAIYDRPVLAINPDGEIATGGVSVLFTAGDVTSLLTAYLQLVRKLRGQEKPPTIDLRTDDIEVLARYTGATGADVVDRLGALMGATRAQRSAMVGLFATGAATIAFAVVASLSAKSGAEVTTASHATPPGDPAITLSVSAPTDAPTAAPTGAAIERVAKLLGGSLPVEVRADRAETEHSSTNPFAGDVDDQPTAQPDRSAGIRVTAPTDQPDETSVLIADVGVAGLGADDALLSGPPPMPSVFEPVSTPVVASQSPTPADTSANDAAIAQLEQEAAAAASAAANAAAAALAQAAASQV